MVISSSYSKKKSSGPVLRSVSPGGRFCSTPSLSSSSSAFASSTSSNFYSSSSSFSYDDHRDFRSHHLQPRSTSPSRVNVYSSSSHTSSVRFFIDNRSISPNRSVIVSRKNNRPVSGTKRTCMCSPTTHPGSFRCSLHKNSSSSGGHHQTTSFPSNRLNMRRSAMANSIVRIGGVEGEWVKRALTTLIRPSSHQQRRRAGFETRPSRLSVMSKVEDG